MSIFKKSKLEEAILPYNGTSGWSGSGTSEERALDQDSSGTTLKRQNQVLEYLDSCEDMGATWKEITDKFGWHHGTSSGILSTLHKADRISRLSETRNRCKIYLLPNYVGNSPTETQGRTKRCSNCGAEQ